MCLKMEKPRSKSVIFIPPEQVNKIIQIPKLIGFAKFSRNIGRHVKRRKKIGQLNLLKKSLVFVSVFNILY